MTISFHVDYLNLVYFWRRETHIFNCHLCSDTSISSFIHYRNCISTFTEIRDNYCNVSPFWACPNSKPDDMVYAKKVGGGAFDLLCSSGG